MEGRDGQGVGKVGARGRELAACSARYALRRERAAGDEGAEEASDDDEWEALFEARVACTGPEFAALCERLGLPADDTRVPLRLTLLAPDEYPDCPPIDAALAESPLRERLPATAVEAAEAALASEAEAAAGGARALRGVLRWAENYLGECLLTALGPEALTGSASDAGSGAQPLGDEIGRRARSRPSPSAESAVLSGSDFVVNLDNLSMYNVDAAECSSARVQLSCGGCAAGGAEASLLLGSGGGAAVWRGACDRCGSKVDVSAGAAVMHEASNRLVRFDVSNKWLPRKLAGVVLGAACSGCCSPAAFRFDPSAGNTAVVRCKRCHTELCIKYSRALIEEYACGSGSAVGTAGSVGADRGGRGGTQPGDGSGGDGARGSFKLTKGAPLPAAGVCSHYRHSHRWFRFPCCGGLYPCDVCHELTASASEKCLMSPRASRQVCGFCSHEQQVSPSCRNCGEVLTGGGAVGKAHTRFWEGGHGERNQALMSRKDQRKYKGQAKHSSKGKTQSAKASRVGATRSSRAKGANATAREGTND